MKQSIRPRGIVKDIHPAELGFDVWDAGSNVIFPNGFAAAAPGWIDSAPGLLARPLWLLPVYTTQNQFFWIYCGNNTAASAGFIGVTDGTSHFDITPAGGIPVTAAGDWTGGVLNGIPVMNHGKGDPLTWDLQTGNPCTSIPNWPAGQIVAAMRPFKYHLVGMNVIDDGSAGFFPELVIWSSAANPGSLPDSWVPDPANEAGNFTISETTGEIIDGGQLRDQFMVYKQHSSTVMAYIAGQFVFSNRKAFVTSGILARNCWQELYGVHYVMTDGDVIKHNAVEVESLVDARIRDFIFTQIDPATFSGCYLATSHASKQLYIAFPKSGHIHADTFIVLDINTGSFGIMDVPEMAYMTRGILNDPGIDSTWDGQARIWNDAQNSWNQRAFNPTSDILVMADYDNEKILAHAGFLREGAAVPIFLELTSKDFGEAQRLKLVSAIWPNATGNSQTVGRTLDIRVGSQDHAGAPIAWSTTVPIAVGEERPKADFLVSGRLISLSVAGNQDAAWRINSIDIDYDLQGNW